MSKAREQTKSREAKRAHLHTERKFNNRKHTRGRKRYTQHPPERIEHRANQIVGIRLHFWNRLMIKWGFKTVWNCVVRKNVFTHYTYAASKKCIIHQQPSPHDLRVDRAYNAAMERKKQTS